MFLAIENPLNSSPLVFPVLECFHIVGFGVAIGTIALVDFRLLGLAMKHQSAGQLLTRTRIWTLSALAVVILTGLLLFSSDPDMYYRNWSFLIKLACLSIAVAFNYTVHRRTALFGASPAVNKIVGSLSLFLWMTVIFGGIYIGFVKEGLGFAGL